jgi:phosphatidylethanolamine-binding protein (PEBP) family uncharacterized protein
VLTCGLLLACACSGEGEKPGPHLGSGGLSSTAGGGGVEPSPAGNGGSAGGAPSPSGGSSGGGAAAISGEAGSGGAGGSAAAGTFTLTSPALAHVSGCSLETPQVCAVFPDANVSYGDNANESPELRWSSAPPGTQSFAVVLFDVTFGQAHWALWNIPAGVTQLPANIPKDSATPASPAGVRQANANFATAGGDGYFGPHLPCNVFELQLYALSSSTFSPTDPSSSVLVAIELQELGPSVLGIAKLAGRVNDPSTPCQ